MALIGAGLIYYEMSSNKRSIDNERNYYDTTHNKLNTVYNETPSGQSTSPANFNPPSAPVYSYLATPTDYRPAPQNELRPAVSIPAQPDYLTRFNQAVALNNTGRKAEAHLMLKDLLPAKPGDSNLLMWLAFTSEQMSEARGWLNKATEIDPNNPSRASAKNWLAGEEARQWSRGS